MEPAGRYFVHHQGLCLTVFSASNYCGEAWARGGGRSGREQLPRGFGDLSLIHISEPTRLRRISYAVFCLKKKNN